jgi:hypothetical protein
MVRQFYQKSAGRAAQPRQRSAKIAAPKSYRRSREGAIRGKMPDQRGEDLTMSAPIRSAAAWQSAILPLAFGKIASASANLFNIYN